MNLNDIVTLCNAGFTKADLAALISAEAPAPAAAPASDPTPAAPVAADPAPDPAPAPAPAVDPAPAQALTQLDALNQLLRGVAVPAQNSLNDKLVATLNAAIIGKGKE